jgi:hypothetical protein
LCMCSEKSNTARLTLFVTTRKEYNMENIQPAIRNTNHRGSKYSVFIHVCIIVFLVKDPYLLSCVCMCSEKTNTAMLTLFVTTRKEYNIENLQPTIRNTDHRGLKDSVFYPCVYSKHPRMWKKCSIIRCISWVIESFLTRARSIFSKPVTIHWWPRSSTSGLVSSLE